MNFQPMELVQGDDSLSLAHFALDLVDDALILVEDERVTFGNKSFFSMIRDIIAFYSVSKLPTTEVNPHILEWTSDLEGNTPISLTQVRFPFWSDQGNEEFQTLCKNTQPNQERGENYPSQLSPFESVSHYEAIKGRVYRLNPQRVCCVFKPVSRFPCWRKQEKEIADEMDIIGGGECPEECSFRMDLIPYSGLCPAKSGFDCPWETLTQQEIAQWEEIAENFKGISSSWCITELSQSNNILFYHFRNSTWKNRLQLCGHPYPDKSTEAFVSIPKLNDWMRQLISAGQKEIIVDCRISFNPKNLFITYEIFHIGSSNQTGNPLFISFMRESSRSVQRNVERRLEDQEKDQVRKILEKMYQISPLHCGIVKLVENNTDIMLVDCNTAMASSLPEGCPRMPLLKRDIGRKEEVVNELIANKLKSKREGRPVRYLFEEGDSVWDCYAIHVEDNYFATLKSNITAQKKLEQELQQSKLSLEETVRRRTKQLEEAVQVKSRFLATMSHEIRTPLSGVMGSLNLLSQHAELSEELHDTVHIGLVCGEQLLTVINDVLDISKIEENRMELEKAPMDLIEVVEESVQIVSIAAEKKGLNLVIESKSLLPEVIGDKGRLRQVLVNLLSNAIKFSSEGEIKVTVETPHEMVPSDVPFQVKFSVKDEGIGIPLEAQQKLFKPFSQADISTTRKYGGSGLGLSISKKLVELMGGTMWLISEENKGSTFNFTIQTINTPTPGISPKSPRNLTPTLKSKRHFGSKILIAEDNPMNQKIIKKLLNRYGYENTAIVSNGKEAVSLVTKEDQLYDLILMDVMMPEMGGIEATEVIRKDLLAHRKGVPIIVALTADVFNENKRKCLAAGMNDVLTKPINEVALLQILKKYCS